MLARWGARAAAQPSLSSSSHGFSCRSAQLARDACWACPKQALSPTKDFWDSRFKCWGEKWVVLLEDPLSSSVLNLFTIGPLAQHLRPALVCPLLVGAV